MDLSFFHSDIEDSGQTKLMPRQNRLFSWRAAISTPGRRQSKTVLTIDERGSNIARNSVFDCHLSKCTIVMLEITCHGSYMKRTDQWKG